MLSKDSKSKSPKLSTSAEQAWGRSSALAAAMFAGVDETVALKGLACVSSTLCKAMPMSLPESLPLEGSFALAGEGMMTLNQRFSMAILSLGSPSTKFATEVPLATAPSAPGLANCITARTAVAATLQENIKRWVHELTKRVTTSCKAACVLSKPYNLVNTLASRTLGPAKRAIIGVESGKLLRGRGSA